MSGIRICWNLDFAFYFRYDRDDFVEIKWENIQTGKEHNFNKYTEEQVNITYIQNVFQQINVVLLFNFFLFCKQFEWKH